VNLLSVPKLAQELNCNITFYSKRVVFQNKDTGKKIGEGVEKNGLYVLDTPNYAAFTTKISSSLLHKRLGHPSNNILKKACNKFDLDLDFNNCDVCRFAKQTRLPFPLSQTKTETYFELVHSDVWGPAPVNSYDGYRYFVLFIDDFSRTTWIYLLKTKSEVFLCFTNFFHMVQTQYNGKLKIFRSDNGTEFINKNFHDFFKEHGIIHQTSRVYTPEQNEISERKNHHIIEMTRCLLLQSNVPKRFWSDAVLTSTYLINRLPTPLLQNKSPLDVLYNKQMEI
jgi:transposase InsO family protein